jgi:integrase/recombinase XerD
LGHEEVTVTHLRKMMLDELQRRNYASSTIYSYIHAVEEFARYFGRSPFRLGPDHIRQYQAHLFRDRKLLAGTIQIKTAALRFLFVKTLKRPYLHEHIPFPKRPRSLSTVLSAGEVERLIASARNLMHRTMMMTLYGTGVRCSELCHLRMPDIDSQRMVMRVRRGKGGNDRDVLLSPKLLETLREYWRWMKPRTYLFPGTVNNWRTDVAITPKVVRKAVNDAKILAGITKRFPLTRYLRHPRTAHDLHPTKICYPCHPLHGVEVEVVRHLRRTESTVLVVRLPKGTQIALLQWMLTPELCDRLSYEDRPLINITALLELRRLIDSQRIDRGFEEQCCAESASGGQDAEQQGESHRAAAQAALRRRGDLDRASGIDAGTLPRTVAAASPKRSQQRRREAR